MFCEGVFFIDLKGIIKIKAKTVTSIEELITEIRNDYSSWETKTFPWFRGEPNNTEWPLLPKLYRPRNGKPQYDENFLLQQFRMKAPSLGYAETPPRDHTDQWLFFAQHVGLPTRLLDWTEGLFIALYFALKEKEPAIWMLHPINLNKLTAQNSKDNAYPLTWFSNPKVKATKEDIFVLANEISGKYETDDPVLNELMEKRKHNLLNHLVHIPQIGNINIRGAWEKNRIGSKLPIAILPTYTHSRMSSQKSCFTIQGLDKSSFTELVDETVLKKYEIPRGSTQSFIKDLKMIGVTHTSIFPDHDNLAKDLSEAL